LIVVVARSAEMRGKAQTLARRTLVFGVVIRHSSLGFPCFRVPKLLKAPQSPVSVPSIQDGNNYD
jgi:hypothetical protein